MTIIAMTDLHVLAVAHTTLGSSNDELHRTCLIQTKEG
jgi:hypothetical protein